MIYPEYKRKQCRESRLFNLRRRYLGRWIRSTADDGRTFHFNAYKGALYFTLAIEKPRFKKWHSR